MRHRSLARWMPPITACALLAAVSTAEVRTAKLGDGLYAITAVAGNPVGSTLLALLDDNGILLVDTAYAETAPGVQAELRKISPAPVRLVVNTHAHDDHVGGNRLLGAGATVVAHDAVRLRMTTGLARLAPWPRHALPALTFATGATLHFAGEELRLRHFPAAHTDGDIAVQFVRAGVIAVGDLVFPDRFPYVATRLGGTLTGYLDTLDGLLAMATADTRFVPAHGPILSRERLVAYRDELRAVERRVREARVAGTAWSELRSSGVLEPWASWGAGYVTADRFLDLLESSERSGASTPRPSVLDPMSEQLVEGTGEAAVSLYRRLKREQPERYDFAEEDLNLLGYTLLQVERRADAIAVFRLNAGEHPMSWNVHDSLGEALEAAGQREAAIAAFERSLELNPASASGRDALRRLRSR